MRVLSLITTCLFFISFGHSQTLSFYADAMINSDQPEHRRFAAEQFEKMFEADLYEPQSLTRSYAELPWLSVQYAQDSSFRTITWQVDHGKGRYAYHGYLQTDQNSITKMGGPRGRNSHESNAIIDLDKWRGGLIYKILSANDEYYLLTYRMVNEFTKVKTLEPLNITEESITIGRENHFVGNSNNRALTSRLAMLYSFDSNAGITYEEETKRLIFDNLVVVQGRAPKQGPTAVPDGSYKAYELQKNGQWTFIEKLFNQTNQGALNPRGKKKLNNELFKKNK